MGVGEKMGLSILRKVMIVLDQIVYGLIDVFYGLFEAVTNVRLFNPENSNVISKMADRIYILIGVYALFKVVFILINMLINPDNVNDKQKGAGKIATRLVVMLMMIIAVPWIFDYAYKFQDAIIADNLISKILIGGEKVETSNNDPNQEEFDTTKVGNDIGNIIFSGFVSINEDAMSDDVVTATECTDSANALNEIETNGIGNVYNHINDTYDGSDGETFCIDYRFFVSLIAGGFAAYMFAVYCLDIGLRVVKLAFYELVAPIPIVTYIDGKKDGAFNNWLKSTTSSYVDLFIRLIVINFIVLIIRDGLPELMSMASLSGYGLVTRNLAKIVVVLGLLMFASQAPKLIKDLFGIKGEGSSDYGMSLTKKLGSAAVVGGALTAGASFVGHSALAGANKVGSTIKNRGAQAIDRMRGMDKDKAAQNYAIRQKAGSIQALSMLDSKNWDSKSHKYTGAKAGALARQALTGNVNAGTGLMGRAQGKISDLTASLSYETGAHKSQALKSTGILGARLGNIKTTLGAQRMKITEEAKSNPALYSQLEARTDFNAKKVFEDYLKSVSLDPTFQNIPSSNDEAAWNNYVSKFMNFEADATYSSLSLAEKEKVQEYAEKALGDLKKEVDTLTKNK